MEKIEYATGKIFKLSVGNNLATYYNIGKDNKDINATIVEILEDTNCFIEYGITKHLIIVEDNKTKVRWLWATPCNLPFLVQYSMPNENQEHII